MKQKLRNIVALLLITASSSAWTKSPLSQLSTDLVLLCEEIEYEFLGINEFSDLQNPNLRNHLEWINERNTNPQRPFLALKYVDKKLSFNGNGVDFLTNQIPNEPNELGWVGKILIKDDAIKFELINVKQLRMRTILTIDRFTGLFKGFVYPPNKEFPESERTGKCSKQNERLF